MDAQVSEALSGEAVLQSIDVISGRCGSNINVHIQISLLCPPQQWVTGLSCCGTVLVEQWSGKEGSTCLFLNGFFLNNMCKGRAGSCQWSCHQS